MTQYGPNVKLVLGIMKLATSGEYNVGETLASLLSATASLIMQNDTAQGEMQRSAIEYLRTIDTTTIKVMAPNGDVVDATPEQMALIAARRSGTGAKQS
jgi:hypothetical protein